MTKWFDTNYHYMVPEFRLGQRFQVASCKPVDEYLEAKALGFETRPVLLGPVTFLKLGKAKEAGFDPLTLLVHLLPVYIDILRRLSANGAEWVQIDEPCLVLDLDNKAKEALRQAYSTITHALPNLKIMLATYFGGLGDNLDLALSLAIAGLHVDLVRAPEQLEALPRKRRAVSSCLSASSTGVTCGARICPIWRRGSRPSSPSAAPTMSRSLRRARCCMFRSTSSRRLLSTPI
jgi:5-methyltetrahydropteroyltriglutamate--homocysteine methyltransferase